MRWMRAEGRAAWGDRASVKCAATGCLNGSQHPWNGMSSPISQQSGSAHGGDYLQAKGYGDGAGSGLARGEEHLRPKGDGEDYVADSVRRDCLRACFLVCTRFLDFCTQFR